MSSDIKTLFASFLKKTKALLFLMCFYNFYFFLCILCPSLDKPALPTFIITPSNTTIEVGKHLEWECASSGSKVSWERLGHASLPPLANITKTGALKFTSVGENDGGVYRCIAGNSSVNVTLTIVGKCVWAVLLLIVMVVLVKICLFTK